MKIFNDNITRIARIIEVDYSHGVILATDSSNEFDATWSGLLKCNIGTIGKFIYVNSNWKLVELIG